MVLSTILKSYTWNYCMTYVTRSPAVLSSSTMTITTILTTLTNIHTITWLQTSLRTALILVMLHHQVQEGHQPCQPSPSCNGDDQEHAVEGGRRKRLSRNRSSRTTTVVRSRRQSKRLCSSASSYYIDRDANRIRYDSTSHYASR